ncbi:MAG TPA: type II secretion system minor pseudopilin GspK [Gammaproteobacteria bacterium]|nr:type II secretion system minor pseudopilin GspK [Gammaproteobacteria bacterium]
MSYHKNQSGVVVVIALFIVALVAAMSFAIMGRLERDTKRTTLLLRDIQAEFIAQGSIAWAMDQLRNDWERQKTNRVIDPIPIQSPVNEVNGYQINSTIYDMQARFNLNNLSNLQTHNAFHRLLKIIDPKLSEGQMNDVIRGIVDWITPGNKQNHYYYYYLSLPIPYRAAHRMMWSVDELRLIKGMTPALFNALKPYIAVLPEATLINVQTAPAPVLMMLSPTLTVQMAQAIIDLRKQVPMTSPEQFINLNRIKNQPIAMNKITVTSQYFLVETNVVIEKQHILIYTLLERRITNGKIETAILWQSKGIW